MRDPRYTRPFTIFVLNILNTAPSRELFARSDRVLQAFVGIVRGNHAMGHPRRVFVENIAQTLRY